MINKDQNKSPQPFLKDAEKVEVSRLRDDFHQLHQQLHRK